MYKKKDILAPCLDIYVILHLFTNTGECDHSTNIGVEPVI